MRITIIATAALLALSSATSALAEETVTKTQAPAPTGLVLTGAVNLDFAETTAGKTAGTMGIELDVDAGSMATIDLDFKATDGSSLTLDTWTVGTTLGAFGLAFGDSNSLLPETGANTVADGTLTVPAMTESLQVTMGAASVALGLTDWTTDVSKVSNLQGAYTLDAGLADVTASVDYNRTSENYVWGGEVSGIDLGIVDAGGMMTYDKDADLFAYEGSVALSGLSAYVNGDESNTLQHIGSEYTMTHNSMELTAGVDYDTDSKNWSPMAGLSFNF